MGKKRERGKERKAKAAAQSSNAVVSVAGASAQQAMVENQPWRKCALVGSTQDDNRCIHGCPVLPAPDHVVSLFIDGLWADACDTEKGPICFMLKSIDNNRQVWDNATLRKMALDIMLAIGTNFFILDEVRLVMHLAGIRINVLYFAQAISILEQYTGDGKSGFSLATRKASSVVHDLCGGRKREIIRFYLKRVSCSCLKAMYSQIKKSQPFRVGKCSTCNQLKELSLLMHCGRCKVVQYCCRECQAADWPKHKALCDSFVQIENLLL